VCSRISDTGFSRLGSVGVGIGPGRITAKAQRRASWRAAWATGRPDGELARRRVRARIRHGARPSVTSRGPVLGQEVSGAPPSGRRRLSPHVQTCGPRQRLSGTARTPWRTPLIGWVAGHVHASVGGTPALKLVGESSFVSPTATCSFGRVVGCPAEQY
jgi:hypothetical protein